MTFPTDTLADKGRRVYEALMVMFNRLRDPALKIPAIDLVNYQKEIRDSVPLLESLAKTKFTNAPGFTDLVDDDRCILMGRMVREMHQVIKTKVTSPDYSIVMTNSIKRAKNTVTYVVYTVLAVVTDSRGEVFYFALADSGQYSFSSKLYWEDIVTL